MQQFREVSRTRTIYSTETHTPSKDSGGAGASNASILYIIYYLLAIAQKQGHQIRSSRSTDFMSSNPAETRTSDQFQQINTLCPVTQLKTTSKTMVSARCYTVPHCSIKQ